VNLGRLALVCWAYGAIGDGAYEQLLLATGGHPNLFEAGHRDALLGFLNRWGCRHIAIAHHQQASQEIEEWYAAYNGQFLDGGINLWELTDQQLDTVQEALDNLSGRVAGARGGANVSFGPVAAAKTLFAIRPNGLVAWDTNIREHYVGANGTYREFLETMGGIALNLAEQCQNHGFEIAELSEQLGSPNKTLCKLMDEYNWMTITKGLVPADRETLERLAAWYD